MGNPEWQSVFQKRPTLEQGGWHSVLLCPSVNGLGQLLGMWLRRWIPFGQSNSLEMQGSWELATAGAQSELGPQRYPQHPSQNKHTPTGNPQALNPQHLTHDFKLGTNPGSFIPLPLGIDL